MSQAARNIKQKEALNQRSQGRSNGARLFGMVFLLLVTGCILTMGFMVLHWMNDASRLPLSKLVVSGDKKFTSNDDIRQAILSLGPPGTFMSQNVDVIQQQIERLPWIKQASVRKQWPDELKIHLVEYVPVAYWNDQHVVDVTGVSFSLPLGVSHKQTMPKLYGPEGSETEVLSGYNHFNTMLNNAGITLNAAAMSARKAWVLTTSNGMRIDLGRDKSVKRLQRFIELYPDLTGQGEAEHKKIDYIDLRYDSGAAVSWIALPTDKLMEHRNGQQTEVQAKQ